MKRWIALAVLAWVALWPLAHRVLVAKTDLNPWKLGGFAMYTTPTPPVLAVALVAEGGRLVPLDLAPLPEPVRRAFDVFQMRRHVLGRLQEPEAFARTLLEARPDLAGVVVMVQRMKLDPNTARMTSTRDRYVYDRSDLAEP